MLFTTRSRGTLSLASDEYSRAGSNVTVNEPAMVVRGPEEKLAVKVITSVMVSARAERTNRLTPRPRMDATSSLDDGMECLMKKMSWLVQRIPKDRRIRHSTRD